jgi:hypothetical protein
VGKKKRKFDYEYVFVPKTPRVAAFSNSLARDAMLLVAFYLLRGFLALLRCLSLSR